MDTALKPKIHRNFYIELDSAPNFIYTDGDIVSGKCLLLSTRDEDVGTISVSFHRTVKSHVQLHDFRQSSQVHNTNYMSENVLFQEKKVLYQGSYTLRKNVLYEWPFIFELPRDLPPSGSFGRSSNGSGQISYELEAVRTRTWQDPSSVERQMDPLNDLKGAPFQPSGLFKKLGTFTGMIATSNICVMPPRPKRVDPSLLSCKVDRPFPSASADHSSGSHHKLSSLLHPHSSNGSIGCTIVLTLPRKLIHFTPINANLQVVTKENRFLPPITLQAVEIHLKCYTAINEDNGNHHNQNEAKISILNQSKSNLPIAPNTCLDLGSMFNLHLDSKVVPSFNHALIMVSYDLRAHIILEAGGKKFKEDFLVGGVKVMSNRTASSPLSRDYLCTLIPEIRRSTFEPSPEVYPGREKEAEPEIADAFLALSRLLSQNSIPYETVSDESGNSSIVLRGRAGCLGPQRAVPSTYNAPPSMAPVEPMQDSTVSDRKLLDTILDGHVGFRATSLPKQQAFETGVDHGKFVFVWHNQTPSTILATEKAPDSHVYIRIEIKDASLPHYPHEKSASSDSARNPISTLDLLNSRLRHAASFVDPAGTIPQSVYDILYIVNEFGPEPELQTRLRETDSSAAWIAAGKYKVLMDPLTDLGVLVLGSENRAEGGKEYEKLRDDIEKKLAV